MHCEPQSEVFECPVDTVFQVDISVEWIENGYRNEGYDLKIGEKALSASGCCVKTGNYIEVIVERREQIIKSVGLICSRS